MIEPVSAGRSQMKTAAAVTAGRTLYRIGTAAVGISLMLEAYLRQHISCGGLHATSFDVQSP